MTGSSADASDANWLARAIELAAENAATGGRPFGAVVVVDGTAVGEGVNTCLATGDPTAHAEVTAIRDACERLGTLRLDGALLVASTEPCPMCQAAALLAGVTRVVFATTDREAAERGYDARELLADLALPLAARRQMTVEHRPVAGERLPYERAEAWRRDTGSDA